MTILLQIVELLIYIRIKELIGFAILTNFILIQLWDSSPPENIKNYIKSKYKSCIYSEYQIQKYDSLCASYCLYIIYCVKILLLDIKKAVLNLYYIKVRIVCKPVNEQLCCSLPSFQDG